MNVLKNFVGPLVMFAMVGCGAAVEQDSSSRSPATRFDLRIDDRRVELGPPSGTKFVIRSKDEPTATYFRLEANEDPRGGDAIRGASVTLYEPFRTGRLDCTPSTDGRTSGGATLLPGPFLGFTPAITDCVVEVTYVAAD